MDNDQKANDQWTAVEQYITSTLVSSDAALDAALQASAEAGLPPIQVAPNEGKLLMLLARACGARRILEIGTLGGYSSIWLARALPEDGRLITLELDPNYAEVARRNIARAGLAAVVEVRVGHARESLADLCQAQAAPFDFVFIDADKASTVEYIQAALQLSRIGGIIVVDNVVRRGAVVDAESSDPSVIGIRNFNEFVSQDRRVSATAIQTVGSKGYDGFAMALVIGS
jgi:predicted O-methyltransferase YrrM